MKQTLKMVMAMCMIVITLQAQKKPTEMKDIWSVKLKHDFDETGKNEAMNYVHGSNDKNFSVLKASDGTTIWGKKFKEIYEKINKVDLQIPMYDSKAVFLFDKKMGKDQMVVVDMETGNMLWNTDKYQNIEEEDAIIYIPEMQAYGIITDKALTLVKARTGEEIWTTEKMNTPIARYIVDTDENSLTIINMPRSFLSSVFKGFKNQVIKLNLKNGDVIWERSYIGVAERKVYTRECVAKLWLKEDKLFLQLNGLQVYDYKTGNPLWSATYDVNQEDVVRGVRGGGRILKKGVYGAVAEPLYDGEYVYLVDMKSKTQQYIRKYEINSGKMIWSSPEIKDAKVLPSLYKINDEIILQVGGAVEVQAKTQKTRRSPDGTEIITTWMKYYTNVRPFNVQAFKVNDGTQIWESERFKKGITNIFPYKENIMVCSGKALYSLDYKTGNEEYEVALGDDNIGLAEKIIDPTEFGSEVNQNNVVIIGEKGVSSHEMASGSKVWNVRTRDGEFNGIFGTTVFYEKENDDQFAIDVNTGGASFYNARKDAKALYSLDGKSMFIFEKKTVSKVSTAP